jgi:hypothetical protein
MTLIHCLSVGGAIALVRSDPRTAAVLCSATVALSTADGFVLEAPSAQLTADTSQAARDALGDVFAEASGSGSELELDEAVQLALAAID